MVQPGSFVVTERVNDKGLSCPLPDVVPVPGRHECIDIVREFPSVGPDFTQGACPGKKLQELARRLNEFDRLGFEIQTGNTWRIAISNERIALSRRNSSHAANVLSVQRSTQRTAVRGFVRIKPFQTFRRHFRYNGIDPPVPLPLPNSREVMRIKLCCGRPSRLRCLREGDRRGCEQYNKRNDQTFSLISHLDLLTSPRHLWSACRAGTATLRSRRAGRPLR